MNQSKVSKKLRSGISEKRKTKRYSIKLVDLLLKNIWNHAAAITHVPVDAKVALAQEIKDMVKDFFSTNGGMEL